VTRKAWALELGHADRARSGIAGAVCVFAVAACGGGGTNGAPPDVSLAVTPTQVLFDGGNVVLAASASGSRGIDSVQFFQIVPDVRLLARVDKPPYEWQAAAYGGRADVVTTFVARACDHAGLCTDSNMVSVTSTVGPPPDVSLTVTPTMVFGGGNVMLAATVSASNAIGSVAFFRLDPDPTWLGSVDEPPFEWQAGAYGGARAITTTFGARACDRAGLCTDSNTVFVLSTWICKFPPC
jgi:hypothetical protein